ncbi:uncharacterized protein LOC144173480 [Haemaphysalis longicornis]
MTSLTRGELLVHFKRYAVGFRRHGVQPGDHVCLHLSNTVQNLVAMYGCVIAGAMVVMAKTSLTEHELRYCLKDSDSVHIVTDAKFTEKVARATASLTTLKGLFSMGSADGFVSTTEFTALDEGEFIEYPVVNPKDAVMAVYYTSGTTGLPKGAEVTHYNFVACFYILREHMPWREGEVSLGSNPIPHLSGLVFLLMPVLNGSRLAVVSATWTPQEAMDAIDQYQATVMVMFPTQLQALVAQMRLSGRRLPTMRHITVGGIVLQRRLSDAACSTFGGLRTLQDMYGMTEACLLVTAQERDADILKRGNDVGLPLATASFKVVDVETGEELGPNQIGEIHFWNASMVKGYYKKPKESIGLFDHEGWMKSGDAGYYDEDGRLYIVERLKQLIKCMNNQVVPGELEDLLLREHSEYIAQVSVVGLPHSEYGEAPAAAIVLTEKGKQREPSDLTNRIKATITGRLAKHKHLYGGVFFVDSLPTTETSKVNRAALARSLARTE